MTDPEKIGRYVTHRVLGEGAMGRVYEAYDPMLERVVALKTIRIDRISGEKTRRDFKARFFREARIGASLQHPNIVSLYDMGEHGAFPFIVMEHVAGVPLSEHFERGMLTAEKVASVFEQLASALDEAHARGIIHRDIKPQNIVVARDGTVKILDFGIARLVDSQMTRTGEFLGSPRYSSPEQVNDRSVDHRSDLFSFGVLGHEIVTGTSPFPAASISGVLFKIANGQYEIGACLPGLTIDSDKMTAIFGRAFQVNPDRRYQTAAAFVDDLAGAMGIKGAHPPHLSAASPQPAKASGTLIYPFPGSRTDGEGAMPAGVTMTTTGIAADSSPPPFALPPVGPSVPAVASETGATQTIATIPGQKTRPTGLIWGLASFLLISLVVVLAVLFLPRALPPEPTVTLMPAQAALATRWDEAIAAESVVDAEVILEEMRDLDMPMDDRHEGLKQLRDRLEINQRRELFIEALAAGDSGVAQAQLSRLIGLGAVVTEEQVRLKSFEDDSASAQIEQAFWLALKAGDLDKAEGLFNDLKARGKATDIHGNAFDEASNKARMAAHRRDFDEAMAGGRWQGAAGAVSQLAAMGVDVTREQALLAGVKARFRTQKRALERDIEAGRWDRASLKLRELRRRAGDDTAMRQEWTELGLRLQRARLEAILGDLRGLIFGAGELTRIEQKADLPASELYLLAHRYRNGQEGTPKDERLALAFFRLAAQDGHADAQLLLGDAFKLGNTVRQDPAVARKWYQKAADQGAPQAAFELGHLYAKGLGGAKDDARAMEYFLLSAQAGYMAAQRLLGMLYERGIGVAPSKATAIQWYGMAARQGDQEAAQALDRLRSVAPSPD